MDHRQGADLLYRLAIGCLIQRSDLFIVFENVVLRVEDPGLKRGEHAVNAILRRRADADQAEDKATVITYEFMKKIPTIRSILETDIDAAYEGDPAADSKDEIILSYPGLFAISVYRIAHELHLLNVPMIPRIMTEYAHSVTGIDIHPGADIGKYFFIDHGTGVVIGETTIIGEHVKIYQGVTLGGLSTRGGQSLKGLKRHPTIGNNVTIYSGASILGGDTIIGDDAVIGGNSFLIDSVGKGARVTAGKKADS